MQNIVTLAGNIGHSPETRTTEGGTSVTRFSLATSRPRLVDGQVLRDEAGARVEDTEWHRIICFNGLGRVVQDRCGKGSKVLVRGRIHYTRWTDATGVDRFGCEIIAENVDFLNPVRPQDAAEVPVIDQDDAP